MPFNFFFSRKRRRMLACAALPFLPALLAGTAFAQEAAWPSEPVRIIVPFASGTTDVLARLLGAEIQEATGQPFVVENKTGAGGSIGSAEVARAEPDGYTLLLATASTHAVAPHLSQLPYDTVADFTPIAHVASSEQVILLSPSLGVKTVQELIDYGKANPGMINYASNGVGTISHLTFELLSAQTGIVMNHIPYKGSGLAVPDVASGLVQLSLDVPATGAGHITSGSVLGLAVTGPKRSTLLPDVPTVAETVPDFSATTWWGLYGPAGMSPELTQTIYDAFTQAMNSPEIVERYKTMGVEPGVGTSADFAAMVAEDSATWAQVIAERKITME